MRGLSRAPANDGSCEIDRDKEASPAPGGLSRLFLHFPLMAGLTLSASAAAFAPFPLPTGSPRAQLGALAVAPGGERFLATWYDPADGALHARLMARDGTAAGPDASLAGSSGSGSAASPMRSAAVYNPQSGDYFVVWQGGGALAHVVGMRIGGDGVPRGGPIVVSSPFSAQGVPSLAVDAAGRLLAVWDDNANASSTGWDIMGLLMEPDGTPIGGDLLLTYAYGRQLAPRAACDPVSGQFLVVWEDERELYGAGTERLVLAQALDGEGNLLGGEIELARTAAAYAGIAVAAEPGTGEFLVAWSDRRREEDPTSPDLRVRRVRATDGTVGPVFPLSSPGEPSQPALLFHAPSRRFLLAWTDRREFAGADSLALARVLEPSGRPIGEEFDLAADAHGPALAAAEADGPLPTGGVLAGWTDAGRGGPHAEWIDPLAPPAPMPHVRDERPYTNAADRLAASWSVVGFDGGPRAVLIAVGTAPGRDDVAPWAASPSSAEPIVSAVREGLRLEEGRTYYFSVIAVGGDGWQSRVGTSPGAIVDRTGPEITITDAPAALPHGAAVTVAFRGRDNLAPEESLRYRWRLDDGAWSLPTSGRTVRLEGLAMGHHRFEVHAIDPAENAGPMAAVGFRVE
jgi:hypothetical protein